MPKELHQNKNPPHKKIANVRHEIVPSAMKTSMMAKAATLLLMPVLSMIVSMTRSKKGAAARARLRRMGRMKWELIQSPA